MSSLMLLSNPTRFVWMKDMLPAVNGLAGDLAAFAGLAMTILLALPTSATIAILKRAQGYRYLIGHFFDSAFLCLLTAVVGVGGLSIDWDAAADAPSTWFFTSVLAGCGLAAMMAIAFTMYYLYELLIAVAQEEHHQ